MTNALNAAPAATLLDLADIQGGILRTYGDGFPKGRNFYLSVRDARAGRAFVEALRPRITTAARWKDPKREEPLLRTRNPRVKDIVRAEGEPDYPGRVQLMKPKVTLNIGFTFMGLLALGVPTRTLRGMPDAFIDGMAARAALLGDDPFLDSRDAVWRDSHGDTRVHILLTLYAQQNPDGTACAELDQATDAILGLSEISHGGVVLLDGVGPHNAKWQDLSAVMRADGTDCWPTNKEHFGLSDGFGDPVFSGQFSGEAERVRVAGGGKLMPDGSWEPLATGEFLLGYPDEAQEIPGAAMPIAFSRNGTFMAYRKLHEDVAAFHAYLDDQATRYAALYAVPRGEAVETIKAKMVGRWEDGVPLMIAPTYPAWQQFRAELDAARRAKDKAKLAEIALKFTNFIYASDPAGAKCPVTSHLRRANPRDALGPTFDAAGLSQDGSAIINRRRILRRGLPYGQYDPRAPSDEGDHGIIFMAICTDLFRQFEFVQQQWMQYGLDFNAGSDTCPVIGNHEAKNEPKLVIAVDPESGKLPFLCDRIPQLVEPRGGDYFFLPSMTALRMIGMGIIDPT
jgi:Dyp-type peroxidase family